MLSAGPSLSRRPRARVCWTAVQGRSYNVLVTMSTATRRIPLDRRVCVVRDGRVDVRPERGALVGPVLGLALSLSLFVSVALLSSGLSVAVLAAMLIAGLILGPFSAMALVHSLFGAHVVIDAEKQSAAFQQGVLGLGLGTAELVPFWKVERLEVRDLSLGDVEPKGPPPPLDLRAWDIVLVRTGGKELSIGSVVAPNSPDLIDEAFDRALEAAEAVSRLVDQPVVITAAVEERVEEEAEESQVERPVPSDAAGADGKCVERPALSDAEGSQRA